MQILKTVSLGNYGNTKLTTNATVTVPKAVMRALSGVPSGILRSTVSAGDATGKLADATGFDIALRCCLPCIPDIMYKRLTCLSSPAVSLRPTQGV